MKFIEVGGKIKIENANRSKLLLDSVIAKIESDRLFITCDQQVLRCFEEGDEIFCTLTTQFGLRFLKSVVIETMNNLVIDYNPKDMEILYQREFIRVANIMPALIEYEDKFINVITKDIGGGGIKFCSDEPFNLEISALMRISLNPNEPELRISGKIIKYNYFRENEYLFSFININENIRSKIIKKCLDIQALQIRKTLNNYE